MNFVIKATECSAIRVNIFCHCWSPLPKCQAQVGHMPGLTSFFWPLLYLHFLHNDGMDAVSHFLPRASFAGSLPPYPTSLCVCGEEGKPGPVLSFSIWKAPRGRQQLKHKRPCHFLGKTQDPREDGVGGEIWKKGNLATARRQELQKWSKILSESVSGRVKEEN